MRHETNGRCAMRIGKQTTCKMQCATCSTQRTTCSSDAPWSPTAPSELPVGGSTCRPVPRARATAPAPIAATAHAACRTPRRAHAAIASACCMLHTACCTLHVACCTLHVACCTLHVAHCILHTACCTLHVACCRWHGAGAEAPACARPSWISTTASHRGPPAHVTTQPVGHHPPSRAPTDCAQSQRTQTQQHNGNERTHAAAAKPTGWPARERALRGHAAPHSGR